jgi:hypothetical protein
MPIVPLGDGPRTVEIPPDACPNGHPLRPRSVLVGWQGCTCCWPEIGHRTYLCRVCGAIGYDPAHTDDRQLGGLERGR